MPNHIVKNEIWLVGTGYMAIEYAKVLLNLSVSFKVIGNSDKSVASFTNKIGVDAVSGGIEKWLSSCDYLPLVAINAVSIEKLSETTERILNFGVSKILVEKPAGLNEGQIASLLDIAKEKNAEIYVAYNRRFYASVLHALEFIEEDKGVSSFNFEFTEWSHKIVGQKIPLEVKQEWLLVNSSHVIDLAFFLGGWPQKISAYKSGYLPWHSAASAFAGAGISEKGALFSYHANWAAPGRWSVEILTKRRRCIFRPMEQLHVQELGSVVIEKVHIDDSLDLIYKPGLYRQVEAFLNTNPQGLVPLEEHYRNTVNVYRYIKNPAIKE